MPPFDPTKTRRSKQARRNGASSVETAQPPQGSFGLLGPRIDPPRTAGLLAPSVPIAANGPGASQENGFNGPSLKHQLDGLLDGANNTQPDEDPGILSTLIMEGLNRVFPLGTSPAIRRFLGDLPGLNETQQTVANQIMQGPVISFADGDLNDPTTTKGAANIFFSEQDSPQRLRHIKSDRKRGDLLELQTKTLINNRDSGFVFNPAAIKSGSGKGAKSRTLEDTLSSLQGKTATIAFSGKGKNDFKGPFGNMDFNLDGEISSDKNGWVFEGDIAIPPDKFDFDPKKFGIRDRGELFPDAELTTRAVDSIPGGKPFTFLFNGTVKVRASGRWGTKKTNFLVLGPPELGPPGPQ